MTHDMNDKRLTQGETAFRKSAVRKERTFVPSGTNSFSVGNGLRFLRYAVCVILMMVVGVSEVWGQTPDYSGTYYIGSDYQTPSTTTRNYDPTDLTNNFYLCPTENWISFGSSGGTTDSWAIGDDKPFLTTYKACLHANDLEPLEPYDLTKAKWTIEYYTTESSKDYYYIKHSSGQYVVLNNKIDGMKGNSPENRIRVHLETLSSEQLADDATRNLALFAISPDGRSIFICPKTQSSVHLTVNNGNGDYLKGYGNNKGTLVLGTTTYGMEGTIGIYGNSNTDDNKYLYLEEVKCATPTISFNNSNGELTITSNTVGATIKYTTDGTDPSTGTTYDDSNKPVINTRTVVKAIAQKSYKEDSEVITQTIVVSPVIDPIANVTYNGVAQEPTVTVKDGETVIPAEEYTVSYSDNISAGTATVTITDKEGGDYIVYGSGSFTIDRKTLTITADDATKVYDGTALTKNTFTNTELASGDNITSVTFSGSQTVVGSSANVPSAAVIKNSSNETVTASYNITYTNGTLEVTRASVTVTADDASKIYGESDPASFTATVTGMVNNESESLITINSISRAEGEDAGNYTITPAGDVTQGNYAVSYVTGTFTITPKSMGDGNIPAVGITIVLNSSGELTEVKDGVKILTCDTDYTYTTATDGSDKVVTVTGKGNYKDSAKGLYANPVFIDPDGNGSEMAAAVYEAKRDMANPSNITPYIVRKVNPTIGTLTISPLGYIPEGVPVLLLSDTEAEGFTASPKDDSTPEITDEVRSRNKLHVASEGGVEVASTEAYLFYRGEFVLTKAGTISSGRFFLYNPNYKATPSPAPSPSPARYLRLVIEEDEDPDSINEELRVKSEELATDDVWYSLDGRKLNGKPTQKGMYINGGKKVIITSQQGNR